MKTSIDYARLAAWYAWYKHGVILGKTQLQKILYICYGVALANNERLFEEKPTAWQFGPVFPNVFVGYKPQEPEPMSDAEKDSWRSSDYEEYAKLIFAAIDKLYNRSAKHLTEWSHSVNGPWYKTVQIKPFGAVISDEDIKQYFAGEWYVGL